MSFLLNVLLRVHSSSLTWPLCWMRRDSGNFQMNSTLKTSSATRESLLNLRLSCLSPQVWGQEKKTKQNTSHCISEPAVACPRGVLNQTAVDDFEVFFPFLSQVLECVSERVWLGWSSSSSWWRCLESSSSPGLRRQESQTTHQSMGLLSLPNLIAWRSKPEQLSNAVCGHTAETVEVNPDQY